VEFGIFDHLDQNGDALGALFENRLKLIELIEQQGFYGYHVAEHHATPLGAVPSPSVFLAAAIQRTRRIRLGPLVYVLPLCHPLRLFEEICMLDHMSNGRLMLGVGRGGALVEHERYGIDAATASARYHEAFVVLLRAFENDVVNFEEWAELGRRPAALPRIGITRHIVVAETDAAAEKLAQRAYARWREAIGYLWQHARADFPLKEIYPETFDDLSALGHGIAGSPATVRAYIAKLEQDAGVNYVLGQMVFGDMSFDEAASSIDLFGREVMPAFAKRSALVS
jgi:alkanesulfonate monooxygenase SsuD/methylene tetrahydromethanopterin reductase-like flavin-dependent oxidoreductase (luciferase family)